MGAKFLDRLGYWNAGAFKNLLKQFIVETDIDLPHPWKALSWMSKAWCERGRVINQQR